jgi:hypothetical protein
MIFFLAASAASYVAFTECKQAKGEFFQLKDQRRLSMLWFRV